MKIIEHLLCLAGMLLILPACQKDFLPASQEGTRDEMGEVTFWLGGAASATRSGSDAFDDDVLSARIAVYNPAGTLVTTGTATGGSAITLSVPVGVANYTVRAIANGHRDPADYQQDSTFMRQHSSFEDNVGAGTQGLEMVGTLSNMNFMNHGAYIVDLERLAAKVQIDRIEHATGNDASISIKGIYLINVNTRCNLSAETPLCEWRQKQGYVASETSVIPLTADILTPAVSIPRDSTYRVAHYFYCYPNLTGSDSSAAAWSPRYTRLVVEALYNGVTCYYPVNIVGSNKLLEANKLYRIETLRITGPGSTSPDVPINKGSGSFSVHVQNWGSGFSSNVTI
ncbi:MAG: FimB/Mfa2 family fimbrial subunit [Bacteroidales bacterium]|nr:FimB/Mfa2 family fimbrial subunit [Bacteroidales bacterium]